MYSDPASTSGLFVCAEQRQSEAMKIDRATANAILVYAGNHPHATADEIAKRFGVSEATVAYVLAAAEAARDLADKGGGGGRRK